MGFLDEARARISSVIVHLTMAQDEARVRSAVHERPATYLFLAIWFALLTGLCEVAGLAVVQFFLHRYIYYFGICLIWMAPAANIFIFAIPGLALFLVARTWPRLTSLGIAVGIYAFLGYLSLLFLYQGLAKLAAVLLAAGLAIQTAHIIVAHPQTFYSVARFTIGWMEIFKKTLKLDRPQETLEGTVVDSLLTRRQFLVGAGTIMAGLTLGAQAWEVLAENRRLANLPRIFSDYPNVLLIVLDTVRAQNLSLYGYDRPTSPQLERFAKNGVYFKWAVSTAPWTMPSHASMFTGRHPHELSVNYRIPLDRTYPTLAEVLSAHGYLTAGFVANIWYCSRESGLERGFTHYEDFDLSLGQIVNSSSLGRIIATTEDLRRRIGYWEELGRKTASKVNGDFLQWLSHKDPQRPFFAFLNYFDAHEPYLPPEPFGTLFGPQSPRKNPRHNTGWKWSLSELHAEMDAYDGSISRSKLSLMGLA
jgi:hypothetical protein